MIKNNNFRYILGFLFISIISTIFFTMSYFITTLIFKVTGEPSKLISFIITYFIGHLLFLLIFLIINNTRIGKNHNRDHNMIFENIIEALNKIANGNFDVFIPIDENNRRNQIAISVNKMAKELGSMEKLRQDFISNVSHEVGSPLTSIIGFAELLKNDNLSIEDRNHYINIILSESKRLSKLSKNLLQLSTLESDTLELPFKEFRLDKQIQTVVILLEPQWKEKEIDINVELPKVILNGNEDLLFEVWSNLLNNSIKFTSKDGNITIILTEDNQNIKFVISDSGIGIAEAEQLHIFERFYKVDKSRDRSFGGNGLGLSIVKKIVELHKGSINLKSNLEKGTTFTVILSKNISKGDDDNEII